MRAPTPTSNVPSPIETKQELFTTARVRRQGRRDAARRGAPSTGRPGTPYPYAGHRAQPVPPGDRLETMPSSLRRRLGISLVAAALALAPALADARARSGGF